MLADDVKRNILLRIVKVLANSIETEQCQRELQASFQTYPPTKHSEGFLKYIQKFIRNKLKWRLRGNLGKPESARK
jgi:hypothetical protein